MIHGWGCGNPETIENVVKSETTPVIPHRSPFLFFTTMTKYIDADRLKDEIKYRKFFNARKEDNNEKV